MSLKVLIFGDERKSRRILHDAFPPSWTVHYATRCNVLETILAQHAFHAACVDARWRDDETTAAVEILRRRLPKLPVIAVTSESDRRTAVALRAHGIDVQLSGPLNVDVLRSTVEAHALRDPVAGMTSRPVGHASITPAAVPNLVPRDEAANRMIQIALRAATSNVAILILGETGTGKNVLAQQIHEQSPLRGKPFITVNCPSLNQELLESDLFGHVRGAFTGAVQDTWGKVAAAEGGTLFLDEIGELPALLQPKLLRLLQEKQYERVGETISRRANVRIIAATNRDLRSEVAAGRFREDLFYRLNVISVEVPPLRSRPADVIAAAQLFLESICRQLGKPVPGISPEARQLLESYSWPGNLRELRNAIERAAVLSDAGELDPSDFPMLSAHRAIPRFQVGADVSLRALETAHIQMVVAKSATLEEAARILEIDKSTLYRKRKAMESELEKFTLVDEPIGATGG
jgi:two-component system, NtrC family, response regulator AlgB